jgi:hypothetical protein
VLEPTIRSVSNSIPVFFNTPRLVIPYRFFSTGAVSNIVIEIRPRNYINFIMQHITSHILAYRHVIEISRVHKKKVIT